MKDDAGMIHGGQGTPQGFALQALGYGSDKEASSIFRSVFVLTAVVGSLWTEGETGAVDLEDF